MTGYLGTLGALAPIGCVATLTGESTRPVSYSTTLGGRTFAQVGVAAPRSWDLAFPSGSTTHGPAQVQAFLDGEHGLGPWRWISEWAQVTNILPPRVAALADGRWSNAAEVGPSVLADGTVAGRTYTRVSSDPSSYLMGRDGVEQIPVLPGVPVTGSAWVRPMQGNVYIVIQWRGPSGYLDDVLTMVGGSQWARASVSATPPDGATYAYLAVTGTCQVTRPALTWTPDMTPYSGGQGASAVLVDAMSHSPILATETRQISPVSYTVREVG